MDLSVDPQALLLFTYITLACQAQVVFHDEQFDSTSCLEELDGESYFRSAFSTAAFLIDLYLSMYDFSGGPLLNKSLLRISSGILEIIAGVIVVLFEAIFSTIVIIGFSLSGWAFVPNRIGPEWEYFLPTAAILLAIVFGTQMDILQALMFWKKRVNE
ncbi:hypothetical protein BDQ17DRAFT_1478325 [Cyathus striatus]|nr:hypothetical protein BDQ17DRAFT_1478325 [Cyathus striatus]